MNRRRLAAAIVLALLGPLPLPHVDSYLPLAVGLVVGALSVKENGPALLALMAAVFVVYAAVGYGFMGLVARIRSRRRR